MMTNTNESRVPYSQIDFEKTLQPGSLVEVRWTNCYYLRADAEVVRVNHSSIRIRLAQEVRHGESTWPIGQEFTVPSVWVKTFSPNNGVFPRGLGGGGEGA